MPDEWPELLTSEFEGAVRGTSNAFLSLLDQLVQSNLRSVEKAVNWPRGLTALRQRVESPTNTGDEAARAEDLWLHAQILVNETVERQWRYAQVLTEKRNKIMREVGQRLITASDVKELAYVLAEALPKFAIPGLYVASYESATVTDAVASRPAQGASRDRSRLLLAYENGVRIDIDGDSSAFESVDLVPGGRLSRAAPYSMVAAPLYFKDEQLGFVLFELGPRVGWIYTALQEQISTALHRVLMVERERLAHSVIEEAHRREERHRLAGELHDSVSQALFSMTLHTRAMQLALQQGTDPSGRVVNGLAELRELTQGALADMRTLIFQLRPDALHEEGLVTAIRRHVAAVSVRAGIEIDVHAPVDRLPLEERAEVELLRVVQEALHNCVKHARASHVDIRLAESAEAAGTLIVEVTDDGVGFDPQISYPGHFGLDGMRERTQRLGGRLSINSSTAGSTVRAVLPNLLRQQAT
jgi:signal transduction histidine kinase